jgi:hypothetical protein
MHFPFPLSSLILYSWPYCWAWVCDYRPRIRRASLTQNYRILQTVEASLLITSLKESPAVSWIE